MTLGRRGDRLLRDKETLRLVAFRPTKDDRWTIGWGHTSGVKEGMTCTPEQAEQWYREDIAIAAAPVQALVRNGIPLSQAMFDALVVMTYNEGEEFLGPAKVIGRALRRRDWFAAWRGMSLYTKQGQIDLRGLAIRRAEEMALFMADPLPPGI